MIDIYKKSEMAALLERHGFTLTKSLGQNFLTDKNIINKIVNSLFIESCSGADHIIEIGPGAGALTQELARRGEQKITAIEIDRRVIPLLEEVLGKSAAVIINEDFMKVDLGRITEGKPYKIIGNLPYYITTPIIMKILEEGPRPEVMVFMIQKEVAQRLTAKPGTKEYGSITVAAQYYCDMKFLFTVSKEVFVPKPKVDSAVVRFLPRSEPPVRVQSEEMFFRVIRAGFGQRRKTLGNSMGQIEGLSRDQTKIALENAEIDPRRRGETLDITEFARLSDSVTSLLRKESRLHKR